MVRKRCVSGKGILAMTKPLKKKLTHAPVSICGTIMCTFFFSMSIIIVGSDIIAACGLTLCVSLRSTPCSWGVRACVHDMHVCAFAYACVCALVRCVCACACACVRVCVHAACM